MNWQNIIPLFVGAIFGFVLKVIHGKIFEKKVDLIYELDKPAFFSVIQPTICFQNLKIWNKGNLPANNVKINLDRNTIESLKIEFSVSTKEQYSKDIQDKVLTLRFERLLPKEELTISFKSEEPLPEDFLVNIKSNEMIFRNAALEGKKIRWAQPALAVISVIVAVISVIYVIGPVMETTYNAISRMKGEKYISLDLYLDKTVYKRGEEIEISYKAVNVSQKTIKDCGFYLEIPGIDLGRGTGYEHRDFISAGEVVTVNRRFSIPNDVPAETYRVTLMVCAKSHKTSIRYEKYADFELR